MSLRQRIAFYLEDVETLPGRAITLTLAALVLISSGIFVAQTYALGPTIQAYLEILDEGILGLFALEYLLRLWLAEGRIRYVFSLNALIDLVAILPFFLSAGNFSFIRIFRAFRILKLVRLVEGKTFWGDRISSEDGRIFLRILFTLFAIIFVYSGLIYQVEHSRNPQEFKTFLSAIYFSVVTMTTVGFGDVTPRTELGQLLTVLMILTGIALIPWQVGDLIRRLVRDPVRPAPQGQICLGCGLAAHDVDARFCKRCGTPLKPPLFADDAV